ncbi:MAG: ABC transporter ATP-binding protein [Methanomicrobiales archaeon]|nr:ABC transporter ATP-binding protein [Methanomicrobiales archaeon]
MIEIRELYKSFGNKQVLRNVNAVINAGEIFTIIGPSGQGKSTLLRIINLLDEPTAGQILFDGVDIHRDKSRRMEFQRMMAMVFQKPVVFDTTVRDDIATGLRYRGFDRRIITKRVDEAIAVIGMEGFGERKARTLSGGEMQRVALARAMVTEPAILLLDEPTANLDPVATGAIEELIQRYNRESGTTIIMSTHDMIQGQRLAHRIGFLMDGTFSQTGTPRDVFLTPKNKDLARFIGVGNIFEGFIHATEKGIVSIDSGSTVIYAVSDLPAGKRVSGCIRRGDITLHLSHAERMSARNVLRGTITSILPVGSVSEISVDCGINLTARLTWKAVEDLDLHTGDVVWLSFKASAVHVMEDAAVSI